METVTVPEVRDILDEQTTNAQHIHRGKIRMAKLTDRRQSVFVCHIIRTRSAIPKRKIDGYNNGRNVLLKCNVCIAFESA